MNSTEPSQDFHTMLRQDYRRLELRDWGRWTATLLILAGLFWTIDVLGGDIAHGISFVQQQQLGVNLRCLMTLILLFSVYSVHQQLVISRARLRLFRELSRSGETNSDPLAE